MTGYEREVIDRIANQLADKYCRSCWWLAQDREEVVQEAWMAALTALDSGVYDASRGDLGGFLYVVIRRHIWAYVLKRSSIASSGKKHLAGLRDVRRVSEGATPDFEDVVHHARASEGVGPCLEHKIDLDNAAARILEAKSEAERAALGAMLGLGRIADLAKDCGEVQSRVRRVLAKLRQEAREDHKLWQTWAQA